MSPDASSENTGNGGLFGKVKSVLGLAVEKQSAISPTVSLSVRTGKADAAKDFQWLEKNIPCQKACPASATTIQKVSLSTEPVCPQPPLLI